MDPRDLPQVTELGSTNKVYATVVSRDDHLVRRDGQPWNADDYEKNPEAYYSNCKIPLLNRSFNRPKNSLIERLPNFFHLTSPAFDRTSTVLQSPPISLRSPA